MVLGDGSRYEIKNQHPGADAVSVPVRIPGTAGALLRFLNGLGSRWNITLFHYRNHGAAWGRVLVAFEAKPADRAKLSTYLDRIGFRYWEETGNPAVELFLR